MDHRIFVGTFLLFGASLSAQAPGATTPPAAQEPAAQNPGSQNPAGQDPDKPVQTPEQKMEQLTQERQRLEREIRYVKDRAKDAKSMLADKLTGRAPAYKSIDAGTAAPKFAPMPAAPKMRTARVGTPEEMAGHGNNTMLLVNGRAIDQASFDALMAYLSETTAAKPTSDQPSDQPANAQNDMRAQRALFELIRTEAVATSFEEHEGEEKLGEAMTLVDGGKTLAELAPQFGVVPGCDPNGKFELTRNSIFGPVFEQVAFQTKVGNKARPFRNAAGFVMLQVDSFDKGASPELDKVTGHALLVPYSGDAAAIQKAQMAINTGQVDILVRDEEVMKLLPPMFRRAEAPMMAPVEPQAIDIGDRTELMKALEAVQAEINTLNGKTDDASKARVRALQEQYGQIKAQLRTGREPQAPNDTVEAPGKQKTEAPAPKKQD